MSQNEVDSYGNPLKEGDYIGLSCQPADVFKLGPYDTSYKGWKSCVWTKYNGVEGLNNARIESRNTSTAGNEIYRVPPPEDTGFTDKDGTPIFVGMWCKGDSGDIWYVIDHAHTAQVIPTGLAKNYPKLINERGYLLVLTSRPKVEDEGYKAISDYVTQNSNRTPVVQESPSSKWPWADPKYCHDEGHVHNQAGTKIKVGDVIDLHATLGSMIGMVSCIHGDRAYIHTEIKRNGDACREGHKHREGFTYCTYDMSINEVLGNIFDGVQRGNTTLDKLNSGLYGEKVQDHLECPNCAASLAYPQNRDSWQDIGIIKGNKMLWCCLCGQKNITYRSALKGGPQEQKSDKVQYNRGKLAYDGNSPIWTYQSFKEERDRRLVDIFMGTVKTKQLSAEEVRDFFTGGNGGQ